jgi:hypothetical protein
MAEGAVNLPGPLSDVSDPTQAGLWSAQTPGVLPKKKTTNSQAGTQRKPKKRRGDASHPAKESHVRFFG